MAQFTLIANVTISVYTVVEADTLEEAIKIGNERSLMSIPRGSSEDCNEEWVADELDGMPESIRVEEN